MKIDYHLKILGEKKEYSPRQEFIGPIINSDSKIFEIRAGNGYGKTFLLNLFGYACNADLLDDKYILRTIKDSISRYNDKDSYELAYDLNLSLPDGKQLILKKESEGERKFNLDGIESNDFSTLHKRISVLYDVPSDPSERLNAVIKDLGIWNWNLLQKMTKYWEYLRGIQSDFNNVRDELKIKSLNETILDLELEIESKTKTINEIKYLLSQLIDYQDLDLLIQEYNQIATLNEKIFTTEKNFKKLVKPTQITKKDENVINDIQFQLSKIRNEVDKILSDLIHLVLLNNDLKTFVEGDEMLFKVIREIENEDINSLLRSDNYVYDLNHFMQNINELEDQISLFIRSEEMGKKFITYNFLKQLLAQIEGLIESQTEYVIENLTKINSSALIEEIEKSLNLYEVPDFSEIKVFFKKDLSRLKSLISELYLLNSKLTKESQKKGVDSDGEKYYKLKGEIAAFKEKIKEKEKQSNKLKYKISQSLDIDVIKLNDISSANQVFVNLKRAITNKNSFSNVKEFIKEQNNKLTIEEENHKKLDESKRMNEVRLSLEEKKNVSNFTIEDQDKINRFTKNLGFIIKNISNFNDVISTMNSGDFSSFKDREDIQFIQVAGKIIAYSMDNKILRPDGEYIELENYNLLKKEFECIGDIRIKKEDISTGLASANYLRQRIENTEGEYVIILLDEIGNMAKNTLDEVIKSIKKLEDQKRLVVALLTQPLSEGIEINEF